MQQQNPTSNVNQQVNPTTMNSTQSKTQVVDSPKKENWIVYGLIVLGVIIITFGVYWFFLR
ncbi:MAG: hypothetical protein QGF74_01985 [Candidatus Nanoarchaeia archaeon]|jgi:hypothetical protein|nr:hypothetical protein [Candidatus Nanoarchaeia archaeon]|tara:strand:+ start:42153 stop:42335 length:183 start_codon:yes stop_codon:yes gene_type:complete